MQSPLALENDVRCTSRTRIFVYSTLLALFLFYTGYAHAEEKTATFDFYPRSLGLQLKQIAESTAAEVQPLKEISTDLLHDINAIIFHIEHHPADPCPKWERFEVSVNRLETLRQNWLITATVEDPYIPSAAALEEIALALQRRAQIWQALIQADAAEAFPITTLYEKSFADVDRLKARTLAVEQYFTRYGARRPADYRTGLTWCEYLETQSWLTELEACRPLPEDPTIRLVSLKTPEIPIDVLKTFSDRANATIHRLNSPTLTEEQRRFLNHPTVNVWKQELESWRADTVTPIHVLRLLEQYEETGGMTDMRALARFLDQLSMSKTEEYQQLGDYVRRQYGMPNVRLFISNALFNNHLPAMKPEIASFRDVIQSQPVVGRRQTDTEMAISFYPHPTRVLTTIDVGVDLATVSRTEAFATQLHNAGQTQVLARKLIELTENGFRTEPAQAMIVGHRMQLVRVNTDFDAAPILSGVFRGIVRNQYEDRYYAAMTETQQKILRQVRAQLDRETEARLKPVNAKFIAFSKHLDKEFDLRIEQRESRTEENWLLTAWGIRSKGALAGNTPAPATLHGSFADLKVHESLPNMLLCKLELEGKQGTVADFKAMLAEKFQQPGLAAPEENDHVELLFASHNPVVVRFIDGRAELTISIAALRLLGKTHRNFQVIVRYRPDYNDEGDLVLRRDGVISLPGAQSQSQFALRAAFGKIFPERRPFPLVPKVLEENTDFNYLTTGHCRIEKGWFALALVEKQKSR